MTTKSREIGTLSFIAHVFTMQKRSPWLMVLMLLCTTVTIAYELFYPYAMKVLVDEALPTKDSTQAILIMSVFAFGYLLTVFSNIVEVHTSARLSVKISSILRLRILRSLLRINTGNEEFENKIPTYLIEDVRNLESSIPPVYRTLKHSMTLVYGSILLLSIDFYLFLFSVVLLPLTLIAPKQQARKIPDITSAWRTSQSNLLAAAKEARFLRDIIQVLRRQTHMLSKFKYLTRNIENTSKFYISTQMLIERTGFLSIELIKFTILVLGVMLVLNDHLTLGGLVGYLALFVILKTSLAGIIGYQSALIRGSNSLSTIQEFIESAPVKKKKSVHQLSSLKSGLRYQNASLQIGETQILKNLNIEIPKGQSVAFVGPSGSGKSSALKLLLMQHIPSSGIVYFDDHPLDQIEEHQYFPKIGVVFQEPRLFEGTIKDNILASNKNASNNELFEAAKKADIYDDIIAFKDGFETFIAGGNSHLSGGERQRITIARALLNNPEILLLDEASSALDPLTDASIEETLEGLRGKHTIVSVSHRLKSIQNFDKIYVFNKGEVNEAGTHAQLLNKKGLYAELWEKQNGIKIDKESKNFWVEPSFLRFVPIFSELDDDILALISKELIMERFDTEKVIFSQGDSGHKMYFIASGRVDISTQKEGTPPQVFATLSTGDFFGEIALLRGEARTAQAKTKSVCILLSLSARQLRSIFAKLPKNLIQKINDIVDMRLKDNPSIKHS